MLFLGQSERGRITLQNADQIGVEQIQMNQVKAESILKSRYGPVSKYMMVVGYKEDIVAYCKSKPLFSESPKIRKQISSIVHKYPRSKCGFYYESSTSYKIGR